MSDDDETNRAIPGSFLRSGAAADAPGNPPALGDPSSLFLGHATAPAASITSHNAAPPAAFTPHPATFTFRSAAPSIESGPPTVSPVLSGKTSKRTFTFVVMSQQRTVIAANESTMVDSSTVSNLLSGNTFKGTVNFVVMSQQRVDATEKPTIISMEISKEGRSILVRAHPTSISVERSKEEFLIAV